MGLPLLRGKTSCGQICRVEVGQLFTVTVVDLGTGLTCVGYARVVDENPPQIMCRDTLLPCSADTSVAALGMPLILENCDTSFSIKRSDRVEFRGCTGDTSAIIYRTWVARDRYGNADTCIQQITLLRAMLADVVFPKDTTLECTAPSTHPDSTGYPRWSDSELLYGGGLCRFSVSHRDVITNTCGNGIGRIIDRIWTVEDLCNGGQIRTHTQTIMIVDSKPPVIVCPPAKTVRTNSGECLATLMLDKPVSIQDACDPDATFIVSTSFGKVGLGPHYFVPEGIHQIIYTAIDACGNTSVCSTTLTVKDEERPIAICDDEVVISLNETGTAVAAARVFDEGSKDNCVKTLYYKVRRMDIGGCDSLNGDDSAVTGYQEWFDDIVFFCCEDVGSNLIPVLLRVYTVNPGPGPIDPAREAQGGDLYGKYNECMSMVRIKDPIPPAVFCPADATVECTEDLTDLSRFGGPVILSGCGYTLDSTVVSKIDHCGRGTIKRIFTVTGRNGMTAMCMQTITIVNTQNLTEKDITWPKDTILTTCGANTDPDFLPSGYRRPQLARQPACGLAAIMYEDKLYDAAPPACFKVFRTWTIIDWCVYDPAKSPTLGRYQHTQIIKVEDNQAPSFVCPPDRVVAATSGCSSAQVTLPAMVATDCSPNISIVNDSRYAASPGANISGVYPIGTTVVTYKISDGCGNVATCKVRITVEDQKAPGVVCYHGLSTSIAQMPGGIMAMVDAKAFDAGSTDNCTDTTNLKFTIRRASLNPTVPPSATQLVFDCADVGTQGIELWATDESGNSAYCLTTILITDNGQLCPPDVGLGVVAGVVKTEGGNTVEKVRISIKSKNPMYSTTNINGGFQVEEVPFGYDYTLVPEKNDDLMNGISTIDLIRLSKHILGCSLLLRLTNGLPPIWTNQARSLRWT
ncbi:MAG: HYR domain-containing protein [Haliscomenobacter sp.]|nr:HYR domain-containing protein [Haliscomenobacter sp.]